MKQTVLLIAACIQLFTVSCLSVAEDGVGNVVPANQAGALFKKPQVSTITITTAGGSKIAERVFRFGNNPWKVFFDNGPSIEKDLNGLLEKEGYDVSGPSIKKNSDGTEVRNMSGWRIDTMFLGNPTDYVVFDSSAEGQAIAQEKLARGIGSAIIGAFEMGVLRTTPHVAISNSSYVNSNYYRNAEYLDSFMLDGIPLGGKKAVVNRVYNVFHKALQEAITISYEDISDEELIRINGRILASLLKINGTPEYKEEVWRGTPYNDGNQYTYVTGTIPPVEKWRDGTVISLREVVVGSSVPPDVVLAPGVVMSKDSPEGKLLTANVLELTCKLDGESKESKLIAEKYRLRRVDIGDRISLQTGLFGTSIRKAK
jgi:hypothetical protein